MISDLDAAVITAVSHGYSNELLKTGLQPEHIQDPDAKLIYAAGLELLHRTPPIPPNKLNLLASTWGNLKNPARVKELISLNGTGDVPAEVVSQKCQERHLSSTVSVWKSKLDQLARDKSSEIRQWLPQLTQELETIAGTGHAYNPLPSAHKGAIIRPVTFRSKLRTLNKLFEGRAQDGGGYRAGWWMVWLGITGRGKCLGKGTPVMMIDGSIKKVEDVETGDQLMGPDSMPRRVLGTTRGIDPLYRVTPVKGDSYVVNEDHILSLRMSSDHFSPYKHGEIVNISVRDYLSARPNFRRLAKGYRVGVDFPEQLVPLAPYFVGLWLGDGTSSGTGVTTADPEIVDYLENFAERHELTLRTVAPAGAATTYAVVSDPYKTVTPLHRKNCVRSALREMDMLNNKHIPDEYKYNGREVRLQVLAGLIDADGFLSDNTYHLILKSEKLIDDAMYVARSLGLAAYKSAATKRWSGPIYNGEGDYWRLTISGDIDQVPVKLLRRKAAPRKQIKNVLVTGIRVEPIGDGEYFGFELDGDGLFLLGDFTVTHNTTFLYTQAVDAVLQKKKVCVISKENQSQVRARILLGLTGLTLKEIETDAAIEQILSGEPKIVSDRDGNPIGAWHEQVARQYVLDRYSALLETHLRIYDWSFFRSTSIKSILSVEDPDQFHFDYIDPNDVQGNDKALGLGRLSGTLEEIAHNSTCHMSGYFQLSGDQRKAYEKSDKHEIPGPFGSTMVGHTADGMVQTKWGRAGDTQHLLKTKCRAGGPVEEFWFRYNRHLWIYQDAND